MSMDSTLKYSLTALLAFNGFSIAEAKLIQILHTNDTHAYLDGTTHTKSSGGMARLKSLTDYYKDKMKEEGVETITLDAGDFSEGNIYYMADRARKSFEVHNQRGLDASAVGNHDYLMGSLELDKILDEQDLTYSLLCANIDTPHKFKTIAEKIRPYKEIEVSGLKIGILGLTTNELFYTWRFEGGKITSPSKAMEKYEQILVNRGNDITIALTHVGYKADMRLAKKSKYIDLIVGGHSHTALFRPIYVESKSKKIVPIVQAGKHTEYLGRLIIDVEKNRPIKVVSYELIPTKYEGMDYKMKAIVEEADRDLEVLYGKDWINEKVGYSDLKPDDKEGSRKWAYFITDVLKERTNADVAIHTPPMNGEEFPIGNVTRRDVINSIPRVFDLDEKYGWSMYTVKVRGAWLALVFEALSHFGQPLTFSGMSAEYKETSVGLKVKKIMVNGEKIKPFKLYTVAFTEGIIRGAMGVSPYTMSLLRFPKNTNIKIWEAIETKLKNSNFSLKHVNESNHQFLDPNSFLPEEALN